MRLTLRLLPSSLVLIAVSFGCAAPAAFLGPPPADVQELVSMPREAGQKRLAALGYEAVYAHSNSQYWWSERSRSCVGIKVAETIEAAGAIATDECESRVADARAVWQAYADGAADVHSAQLDGERARRTAAGFQARFWVKNVSADKANSIEYWLNPSTNTCAFIVFRTADGALLNTEETDADRCTNPAPGH